MFSIERVFKSVDQTFKNFDRHMDQAFKQFDQTIGEVNKILDPEACDIFQEKDGNAIIRLDVPGIAKENLEVSVEGKIVTIRGSRKIGDKTKTIEEQFSVGSDFNATAITATLRDGVLEVKIPTTKTTTEKRIIPIT